MRMKKEIMIQRFVMIRKYLSGILHTNIGDSEGMDSPVQVVSLF